MEYGIKINGKGVNAKIKSVFITDRQGAKADDISILLLNDAAPDFEAGDTIECSFGGFKSGKMNIDKLSSGTTATQMGAVSTPVNAKERRTRHWRKVRLFDIVNDIAIMSGLSVFYHGIQNHLYENVTQFNETNLAFLQRLCAREGYALKVDDDRIVLYSKALIDGAQPVKKVTQSEIINNKIAFSENPNRVRSVTVKHFADRLIEHTATSGKYGEAITIKEYVADEAEAERFAKNYLASMKQNDVTVDALIPLTDGIAAGCCVEFDGFARFDGKYIVSECCHDPENEQTRLQGRKVQ